MYAAGGESIYGSAFADEFHSRLRFKHRGLVACAGVPDKPNTNGSQFFVTLDRCDWLDKKHTIFGKVIYADFYITSKAVIYYLVLTIDLVAFHR